MRKKLKEVPIAARITVEFRKEIDNYLEVSPEMSLGRLIRLAVKEYIWGHPIETNKMKGKENE